MRGRLWVAALAFAAVSMAGCLTPLDPADADVREVRVSIGERSLAVDTMPVRATRRAYAVALAAEGYDVGLTRFAYSSSDERVATVDSLGTVRGIAPGEATITATTPGGARGSARVVVVPSTIAYTIPLGGAPGAIAFSPDYTKAYVAVNGSDLAIVDALGFFRVQTLSLGLTIGDVATTSGAILATHPLDDSVTVIDAGTKQVRKRLWVGAGPTGAAAVETGEVLVAARFDRRLVAVDAQGVRRTLLLDGEPLGVRASRDGVRAFVTVKTSAGWRLEVIDASSLGVIGGMSLPGEPVDLAANGDGSRVWVLAGSELLELAVPGTGAAGGSPTVLARTAAPQGSAGLDVRDGESPLVIVSGAPLTLFDAGTLAPSDAIAGAGLGRVAVRPDGLFAFIGAPASGVLHVIGL
jgi:DNA-binding beta-propeller fold protein YncE